MTEIERLRKNVFDNLQEIERLNNIINGIENKLHYEISKSGFEQDYQSKLCYENILDDLEELQELKGSE